MNDARTPPIHGLVPAGGVGLRAQAPGVQTPKQYRPINGQMMLALAVKALLADPRVTDAVVGVQADDPFAKECLSGLGRVNVLPTGGASRALTVLQTLDQGKFGDDDWVLVHDAARPGLPLANLSALIDACLTHQRGGLLAMPAADTVKLASIDLSSGAIAQVDKTLDRQTIWLAQTPQMFRVGELRDSLSRALAAGVDVTDEASAMEWAGHQPLLINGSARNLKVTWAEDFEWIEGLL
ncbi:MAG: 2-C-methyl-D-erythritol 4-phosphate cytidylyltransferase [Burkholderiaceae bacterium]|nr:2-C-methyl-D-erythritol 4-phosphate cytidylyltransferase [Burkholderiaceae bacterium]MCD8518148.1 2-C-methyl-D-erythritol 4-phosphate cytidylyltransferase [Burkholderiaceae bacterium]MCD8537734.1 2-C-methyl-D-erythritol 4-phosphate cytidylyltransferase [Burkholderiaceae bacterium]MCD8564313.1 2-C-methyl-D-erythritol 4-phosphate cytidylyltransferase [Burkholderiaceae bacterium]